MTASSKSDKKFERRKQSNKIRTSRDHLIRNRIVFVNSIFLQRPKKRSRGNQLIHRRLSKPKSIGGGSDPERQAGRQSDGYGGWCLELRRGGREVGRRGQTDHR